MKKLTIIIGLLVAAQIAYTQNTVNITLNVKGMLNRAGLLQVSVFNSAANYLKEPVRSIEFKLEEHDGDQFIIEGLPKGEYAISVVHDENSNGELDFGAMGPDEGYGFSNNPPAAYGPAPYNDARLTVEEDIALTITLN